MIKGILITAAVCCITLTGCFAGSASTSAAYKQISQSEAVEMMQSTDACKIIDVRTAQEYTEGHIPDAVNIPNESIDENVAKILPEKDETLLIYCRSGNRSKQASQKLAELGYTNVYEFGGINTWSGEIVK